MLRSKHLTGSLTSGLHYMIPSHTVWFYVTRLEMQFNF